MTWLSYDMARALAVICPPLDAKDVASAADELTTQTNPVPVVRRTLRLGANHSNARGVVDALSDLAG